MLVEYVLLLSRTLYALFSRKCVCAVVVVARKIAISWGYYGGGFLKKNQVSHTDIGPGSSSWNSFGAGIPSQGIPDDFPYEEGLGQPLSPPS